MRLCDSAIAVGMKRRECVSSPQPLRPLALPRAGAPFCAPPPPPPPPPPLDPFCAPLCATGAATKSPARGSGVSALRVSASANEASHRGPGQRERRDEGALDAQRAWVGVQSAAHEAQAQRVELLHLLQVRRLVRLVLEALRAAGSAQRSRRQALAGGAGRRGRDAPARRPSP